MKKFIILFALLSFSICLSACESAPTTKITMPLDDYKYEKGWLVEDLKVYMEELGFTNIETIAYSPMMPHEYGVWSVDIYGGFSDDRGFDAGDIFDSNDKVTIKYYDIGETLTIDNCPELAEILSGKTTAYLDFVKNNSGKYIEFDGFVVDEMHEQFGGVFANSVGAGDYSESEYCGVLFHVDIEHTGFIDLMVGENQNVKVIGQIDESWSEYWNSFYIEAVYYQGR